MRWLAGVLHAKMHQLFSTDWNTPGKPSKVPWFRLFKHVDYDESGLISYVEFEDMVRSQPTPPVPSSPRTRFLCM